MRLVMIAPRVFVFSRAEEGVGLTTPVTLPPPAGRPPAPALALALPSWGMRLGLSLACCNEIKSCRLVVHTFFVKAVHSVVGVRRRRDTRRDSSYSWLYCFLAVVVVVVLGR